MVGDGSLVGAFAAHRGAARNVQGGAHDAGEVLQHAVATDLDEQGVELGIGPRERDAVPLPERVPHDLDHVDKSLLHVLAAVPGGEPRGERLDAPPQLVQLTALIIALGAVSAPFDDVGIEQIPVTDRAHPGPHIGAGAHQALGLQDAQGFPHDGTGHLETLADLLGDEGAVRTQVSGDDHLAELLNELAVQAAASAGTAASRHPAKFRLRGTPGRNSDPVLGGLGIGVAVDVARTGEAGVGGTGGGHHGVRNGTHKSFVGALLNGLEFFGEKHTKG